MKHIPAHPRSARAAVAFEQALNAQGAVLLEDEWLGARAPHRLRCAEGHEVTAYPEYVHKGGGICSRCSGVNSEAAWEQFQALVATKGGVILGSWLRSNARVLVRCAEGHENMVMPATVQQGGGICKTCAGLNPAVAEARFRRRLKERGMTLLEPAWLGVNTPHRVRCSTGHLFAPTPGNLRRRDSGGCPFCAGHYWGKGAEAFRRRLEELGATLLETGWLGAGTSHHAICVKGHDCWPYPNAVKLGSGICITCAGQDKAVAEAEFRVRLTAAGATLLEPEYLGANAPHRAICAEGHRCAPWPTSLQRGGGVCVICSRGAKWNIFYVVTNPETHRVKFGVTTRDQRPRLAAHRSRGYQVVELLLLDLPEGMAFQMEEDVKITLRLAGEVPVHGREYYDISNLGLICDIASNYLPGLVNAAREAA